MERVSAQVLSNAGLSAKLETSISDSCHGQHGCQHHVATAVDERGCVCFLLAVASSDSCHDVTSTETMTVLRTQSESSEYC